MELSEFKVEIEKKFKKSELAVYTFIRVPKKSPQKTIEKIESSSQSQHRGCSVEEGVIFLSDEPPMTQKSESIIYKTSQKPYKSNTKKQIDLSMDYPVDVLKTFDFR